MAVRIYFNNTPEEFIYNEFGQSFEVEDLDAFLLEWVDVLVNATKNSPDNPTVVYYVTGQDAESFYTFDYFTVQILPHEGGGEGGGGGLP